MKNRIEFLNTVIDNVTLNDVLSYIDECIFNQKKGYIVPVNTDMIIKMESDIYLRNIVNNSDLVLMDGKPLVWVSKFMKTPILEKISGSDLVPTICEQASKKGYTIFIIGGKEGVAQKARHNILSEYPKIKNIYTYSPPFGFEKNSEELEKINNIISANKPDILIVCFGCPKQEKWIYENYCKYDASVSICAGATVDFLAGNVKRAPKWMSNYGLEWFYRFLQEPKRMFKRYFVDDMKIFKLIYKYYNGDRHR